MSAIFLSGDKLENGHYTVLSEVGVGGMGIVYRCRDELLLRDVAIKMLLPEVMADKTKYDVFWQEARLAAQLEHPNVVTIYDIGVEMREGQPHHYLAMEFLPGGNLALRLTDGPPPIDQCLNWMKQLVAGLGFAHKCGVIHQDIKAENVFITNVGDLKIGDFGLARLLVGRVHLSASNRGMGTPAYMSPELCRGEPQDYRSDIYSLGVLFFEIATHQLPFQANGMIEMAMKHSNAPVPSLRRLNPNAPPALEALIHKMMAKNQNDRFQSAAEILNVIDELIFDLRVKRLGLRGESADSLKLSDGTASKVVAAKPAILQAKKGADISKSAPKSEPTIAESKNVGLKLTDINHQGDLSGNGQPHLSLCWTFKSNGPIGWSSQPVIDLAHKVLYVGSADGFLYAIEGQTGAKLWDYYTGAPILTSPVLSEDSIVVTSANGSVSLISCNQADVFWTRQTGHTVVSTPCIVDGLLIVVGFDGMVKAIDLKKGTELWHYDCKEQVVASPLINERRIFIPTKAGTIIALSIDSDIPNWTLKTEGALIAGSTYHEGILYFGTVAGFYYAVRADKSEVVWRYDAKKPITSRGAVVSSRAIFLSKNESLFCCKLDDGNLVWQVPVKGSSLASVVVRENMVFTVTRAGGLMSFAIDSGRLLWRKELGRGVESTPLITSKMLFVPSVEGDVLAYKFVS